MASNPKRKRRRTGPPNYPLKSEVALRRKRTARGNFLPGEARTEVDVPIGWEVEMFQKVADGEFVKTLGSEWNMTPLQVRRHLERFRKKHNCKNLVNLIAFSIREGWIK